MVTRGKNDPNAGLARSLIPGTGPAYYLAGQTDQLAVPQAMARVKVDAPGGKIQLPVAGGLSRGLTILSLGDITFVQIAEAFTKLE